MDIQPGSQIKLEITKTPKRAAALKTLRKLCGKDETIRKANKKRKAKRPSWETWVRGGKFWHHQMKTTSEAKIERGETFELTASMDVLRELPSVSDCIRVQAVS